MFFEASFDQGDVAEIHYRISATSFEMWDLCVVSPTPEHVSRGDTAEVEPIDRVRPYLVELLP